MSGWRRAAPAHSSPWRPWLTYPGSLTRQQYVDIVAYVLKTNEVPFTGDLPMDADGLKKVSIKKKE